MIDEFAKSYLHDNLRDRRAGLVGKLDGLSEYEVRQPLTRTGTNLLGLVKHLTLTEARYFGAIFERPYPETIATFDDPAFDNRDHMWVTERERRNDIVTAYHRACAHADETIEALPIDAPGHVPWWPRPNVKLFNIMVHVLTETSRHLGHADVLREELTAHWVRTPPRPPRKTRPIGSLTERRSRGPPELHATSNRAAYTGQRDR